MATSEAWLKTSTRIAMLLGECSARVWTLCVCACSCERAERGLLHTVQFIVELIRAATIASPTACHVEVHGLRGG
jgi:hypothetical protein